MTPRNTPTFRAHATEGMLDVILGCTLIFLLLTALVKTNEGAVREVCLPDMDLSRVEAAAGAGTTTSQKTVISLKQTDADTPAIWIDDRQIAAADLPHHLRALGQGAHVALRRDRDLSCGAEDRVIQACRDAGITRVAIMLKEKE